MGNEIPAASSRHLTPSPASDLYYYQHKDVICGCLVNEFHSEQSHLSRPWALLVPIRS